MSAPSLFAALATPRLRLEPVATAHAAALFEALQDPSLYAYVVGGPPMSVAALERRYAMLAGGRSPDNDADWLNWTLFESETDRPVGLVQATLADERSVAILGYDILRDVRRRGFGREAVGALRDHLVRAGIGELRATVDVRNAASQRLLESLAFRREKTERSDDVIAGVRGFDHHYVYRPPAPR